MHRNIQVSDQSELEKAIKDAKSGDTIILSPGKYNKIELRYKNFDEQLTIKSADSENMASIERIQIHNSTNVHIEDLHFQRRDDTIEVSHFDNIYISQSQDISIKNNLFNGSIVNDGSVYDGRINDVGVYGAGGVNISIEGNTFRGTHRGIIFSGLTDSVITENHIVDYLEDGLSLSYIDNVEVSRNVIENPIRFDDEHLDFIQIREMRNSAVSDNVLLQGDGVPSQGILIAKISEGDRYNGGNVIENNIIYSGMRNALYMRDISDTVVRNNVVITPDEYYHVAHILVEGDRATGNVVTGNVASGYDFTSSIVTAQGGTFANNAYVQKDRPLSFNHVGNTIANGLTNEAAVVADFFPTDMFRAHYGDDAGLDADAFDFVDAVTGESRTTRQLDMVAVVPGAQGLISHQPGVQDFDGATLIDGGVGVSLRGNAWVEMALPFTVSPLTTISFDLTVHADAEIYGVGLLRNGGVAEVHQFQIDGDQTWSHQIAQRDLTPGVAAKVSINVGAFASGAFDGLVFVADDDAAAAAHADFSNIRIDRGSVDGTLLVTDVIDIAAVAGPLTPFRPQQQYFGTAVEGDDGVMHLNGNAWASLATLFFVEPGEVLEFTVDIENPGEIIGVALLQGGGWVPDTFFQLAGDQTLGVQNVRLDAGGATPTGPQTVRIALNDHAAGWYDGFLLIADDDMSAAAAARFSDIRLLSTDPARTGDMPDARVILRDEAVFSFNSVQDQGVATISADDSEIVVSGNGWKSLKFSGAIGADSVVTFEFRAPEAGEIHAIGFETDDTPTPTRFFQLAGDQIWGLQDFHADGPPDGWRTVSIRLGDHFAGDFDRIVLVADDDADGEAASVFRNIVFEDTALLGY